MTMARYRPASPDEMQRADAAARSKRRKSLTANLPQPRTPAPSKTLIEDLLRWGGGSMTTLPYTSYTANNGMPDTTPLQSQDSAGFWGRFYYEVLRDMRFYRLEFQDEVKGDDVVVLFPQNFPIRLPPTCPAKVQSAVDQINIGDPQVKVYLPEGFRNAEKRAEIERKLAKFCRGLIQQEERDSDVSPLRDQAINTIAYGLGTRYLALDMHAWPEKPERKRGESAEHFKRRMDSWHQARRKINPFVVRSIHPLNVMYDRAHTRPRWVILRESINRWDAAKEYPEWGARQGSIQPGKDAKPPVLTQYIDDDYYGCWIDGVNCLPEAGEDDSNPYHCNRDGIARNPYGRINAWFSAGGSGEQDPHSRPEYELAGIIRKNRSVLLADASLFNQEEVWRMKASLGPKWLIQANSAPDRERMAKQVMGNPLKSVEGPLDAKVTPLEPMQMPAVLRDQRERLDRDIDRGMVYDVASGAGTPTEPAARTRVRLFQVDKRLATAALHIEQCLESGLEAAIYMIRDVLQEPVGVNVAQAGLPADYVDLSPDEIPDGIVVDVNLIGDSEEEKARLLQMGESRLKAGSLDLKTYMTDYAKDADPDSIMVGIYVDFLREQVIKPTVAQIFQGEVPMMLAQFLSEKGVQFSDEELAAAMPPPPQMDPSMGGGGGMGMPGMPPGIDPSMLGASVAGADQGQGAMMGGMGGAPIGVGPDGAQLPGLPGLVPAEGDNPMVSRPTSPEALAQQLSYGLPAINQGPPVRMAGGL